MPSTRFALTSLFFYPSKGEPDCQDQSDERTWIETKDCAYEPSFYCDDSLCPPHQFSCGDGECILSSSRIPLRHRFDVGQFCKNLRDHVHVCELSQGRFPYPLWTQEHSGSCLPWPDDERISRRMNLSDYCRFLVQCALTNGLQNDCPCGGTNRSACYSAINEMCGHERFVIYPARFWIAPFILSTYNVIERDWNDTTPDSFVVNGSIKCRGYHGERYGPDFANISLTFLKLGTILYEHLFCNVYPIVKNYSSLTPKYDQSCWAKTDTTFNNQSYLFDDVCQQNLCFSRYRIQDSLHNCQNSFDEKISPSSALPLQQQNFRFQCSDHERKSLLARAIGDKRPDCATNERDEYTPDNSTPLTVFQCTTHDKSGCSFLKNYITKTFTVQSLDQFIGTASQTPEVVPFHYYCDTFWDLVSKEDESFENCQNWICPKDQYQCLRSKQCIPKQWICDGK
ncbi:unnamed protein product [Rotaria sp. Silwood2]|nr:unnamed protein product [Rotaria sp. Silwood2]CAF3092113.1 unnamed protein product [Rotaria sp. Silwood2]CAF3330280.1 unnamed protein product [Rotaria sp. Silwood2]CAF3428913.1 unnamed protein product [Rotaria sp. Silwood2]CAF4385097.1 unnamed protein product [Rotaria sp. Silwood2]